MDTFYPQVQFYFNAGSGCLGTFPVSMFWGHWEHFISDGVQGGAKSGICLALEDFHFGKLEEEGFAAEFLKLHNGLEV